jgi:nucleoside-diphosphate-sugar epimerase
VTRVLVTGATGFTARHVIPLLIARGFDVRGVSSSDCDVRDADGVRQLALACAPQYVVHLAGTPNVPDAQKERAFGINAEGTRNLLAACASLPRPPQKILIASSCFVYGDTGADAASESKALRPMGEYGKSKLQMEEIAAAWFGRLPIVIARPFNYTGVGHGPQFLVPKLVRFFRDKGEDASFVDAGTVRDYSDVRWIAAVYADLLVHPDSGFAVNVCSGIGTPLPKLVEMLEGLTGHRARIRPRPADGAQHALVGSPEKLRRLLGRLSPYSLSDTLSWMLKEGVG